MAAHKVTYLHLKKSYFMAPLSIFRTYTTWQRVLHIPRCERAQPSLPTALLSTALLPTVLLPTVLLTPLHTTGSSPTVNKYCLLHWAQRQLALHWGLGCASAGAFHLVRLALVLPRLL